MKPTWKTCLRVGVSVFLLYLAIQYWGRVAGFISLGLKAAKPMILGACAAFVLNIPMRFFERHYFPKSNSELVKKTRRPVCLTLALLSVAAGVALVLRLVIPELVQCITLLVSRVPGVLERLGETASQVSWINPDVAAYLETINWQQIIERMANVLISGFGNVANLAAGIIASLISTVVTSILVVIFAIYVLLSKEKLGRQFKAVCRRYLKQDWWGGMRHVFAIIQDCFYNYIVGQCTEAIILGVLCALGMVIFRFPYAAVVGTTVGVTALIPVAGAYIGGVVGFLLVLTESPMRALLFVVYLLILQQLDNNIVYPKVVGNSMGLPGIWVLCAVILGGGIWGIPGMMLGVPLASACYRLLKEDVAKGPIQRKVKADGPDKDGGD